MANDDKVIAVLDAAIATIKQVKQKERDATKENKK